MLLRLFVSFRLTVLALYLGGCGPTLTPTLLPGTGLRGATWQLIYMGAPADQATALTKYNQITATFSADGRLNGNGGCNSFMGGFTQDGDRLTVGPVASTKKACQEGNIMQQEQQFLAALQKSSTFATHGNDLRIRYDGGAGVLVFTRTP